MDKSRLLSIPFWVGIVSAVALGLKVFGIEFPESQVTELVYAIFALLAAFGVATNPSSNKF